jgi:hypothetical protein
MTFRLNRINPWNCLLALVRHANQARANPDHWLHWNYREALPAAEAAPLANN